MTEPIACPPPRDGGRARTRVSLSTPALATLLSLAPALAPAGVPAPVPAEVPAPVSASPPPGTPDLSWFADDPYPADSSVHAYVIAHDRTARLVDSRTATLKLVTDVHRVVRVLDAAGKRHATVEITLYQPKGSSSTEVIRDLRAWTHTLTPAGRSARTTPLDDDQVFTTRLDENRVRVAFSFAAVQPGSVLELSYTVRSDFITSTGSVYFQEDIPVQHAGYTLTTPGAFAYKAAMFGYAPIASDYEEVRRTSGGGSYGASESSHVFTFSADSLAALTAEPYTTTVDNFRAHVRLELERYGRAGGQVVDYSTTWDDVADNLRAHDEIKRAVKGHAYYDDWAAACPAGDAEAQYYWAIRAVAGRVSWNGTYSRYPGERPQRVRERGTGTTADVNVQLLGLLRALGHEAWPLYVNRRDDGYLYPEAPNQSFLTQFLVGVKEGERLRLLDATDPTSGPDVVAVSNLNGEGLLVERKSATFVGLHDAAASATDLAASLTLGDDGAVAGRIQLTLRDYAAHAYTALDGGTLAIDPDELAFEGYTLANAKVERLPGYAWVLTADIAADDPAMRLDGEFVLSPLVLRNYAKNPFARERRSFPVEFAYKVVETQRVDVTVPGGHALSEVPAPVAAVTPDKSALYRYSVRPTAEGFSVNAVLAVKKLKFEPAEYGAIRGLFEVVSEKEGEPLSVGKP